MLSLPPILTRFVEQTPVPVMARALIERVVGAQALDAWFEEQRAGQYTRELLFSTLFGLMTQVVLRESPSVHAAYRARIGEIGVSVTSVYNKLNGLSGQLGAGLVRRVAEEGHGLITRLGTPLAAPLPGYEVRVLDGNTLGAREHRLRETRTSTAAPLPGKHLAVLDPARGLILDLLPCTDAYTQERALLAELWAQMQPGELWIADRNFCIRQAFAEATARGACVLLREHGQRLFTPCAAVEHWQAVDGAQIGEQRVRLAATDDWPEQEVRRICVRLAQPTRDGDDTLYLLCTLPEATATAVQVAELYHRRWSIEAAFLSLTKELRCEVDTLAQPGAALFAFACAAVAYNLIAIIGAALRAAHGHEVEANLSRFHLGHELERVRGGLEVAVEPEAWAVFTTLSVAAMATWLLETAAKADLRRYKKASRGLKKPPVKRSNDPAHSTVSTARLLAARKERKTP